MAQKGMTLTIRPTGAEELPRLGELYRQARDFMARRGNPNQWGPNRWPPEDLLRQDIAAGHSYVCLAGGRIVGTFFYQFGPDIEPTYRQITGGSWGAQEPYGVVHRLAGDGSVPGIGAFCLDWAWGQCGYLRVDTHPDNRVMQRLLDRLGFVRRGTIYVPQDPYPRFAYDKGPAGR